MGPTAQFPVHQTPHSYSVTVNESDIGLYDLPCHHTHKSMVDLVCYSKPLNYVCDIKAANAMGEVRPQPDLGTGTTVNTQGGTVNVILHMT